MRKNHRIQMTITLLSVLLSSCSGTSPSFSSQQLTSSEERSSEAESSSQKEATSSKTSSSKTSSSKTTSSKTTSSSSSSSSTSKSSSSSSSSSSSFSSSSATSQGFDYLGYKGIVRIYYWNQTQTERDRRIWVWFASTSGGEYNWTGYDEDLGAYYDVDVASSTYGRYQGRIGFIIKYPGTWTGQTADLFIDVKDYGNYVTQTTAGRPLINVYSFQGSSGMVITPDVTKVPARPAPTPKVTCTFKNYDDTVLSTQAVEVGSQVTYSGSTPAKPEKDNGDGTITKYTFTGWDKSLKNIQADTVFTAQFSEVLYYECKFVNYNGTVLYTTHVFGGGQASYSGATPKRDPDVSGTSVTEYTFKGWDKALTNIKAATTFTAQYTSAQFTGYRVEFQDEDGSTLHICYCKAGTTATYPNEMPWSYDATNVRLFIGWSGSVTNITTHTTVKAKYKTLTRHQNGEYPQTKVSDDATWEALTKLVEKDAQGYYTYKGEKYYRNGIGGNFFKVEPIKWKILSATEGDLFVISEKSLAYMYYDGSSNNYKNSSVRNWLINSFFNEAFYYDDSKVKLTAVDNSVASTGHESNPYVCETTYDHVFLLSRVEASKAAYGFTDNASRLGIPSDLVSDQARIHEDTTGVTAWWLRSPYYTVGYSGYCVYSQGAVQTHSVGTMRMGIRPALHLDVS